MIKKTVEKMTIEEFIQRVEMSEVIELNSTKTRAINALRQIINGDWCNIVSGVTKHLFLCQRNVGLGSYEAFIEMKRIINAENEVRVMLKSKKSESKSTDVAVSKKNNNILNSLDQLKLELQNLKTITETSYKTEGIIDNYSNIQEEKEIKNLIILHSSVRSRRDAYQQSMIELCQNEAPVFTASNYTFESITHDILLRIAVLKHADRKKTLEDLVKEGEQFLTKEHQFELYQRKLNDTIYTK
jgi:hypothetical protein